MCKHEHFIANVTVNRMEDVGRFMADITIKCTQCGMPFQFLGLQPGYQIAGAAMSIDGLEARIAIRPNDSGPSPLQQIGTGAQRFDA